MTCSDTQRTQNQNIKSEGETDRTKVKGDEKRQWKGRVREGYVDFYNFCHKERHIYFLLCCFLLHCEMIPNEWVTCFTVFKDKGTSNSKNLVSTSFPQKIYLMVVIMWWCLVIVWVSTVTVQDVCVRDTEKKRWESNKGSWNKSDVVSGVSGETSKIFWYQTQLINIRLSHRQNLMVHIQPQYVCLSLSLSVIASLSHTHTLTVATKIHKGGLSSLFPCSLLPAPLCPYK